MSKFKVGDEVKITKLKSGVDPFFKRYLGMTAHILDCSKVNGYILDINCEDYPKGASWFDEELELVTSKVTKITPYMRKKYMLLKETDTFKKGAIFEEKCDDGTQGFKLITPEKDKYPNDREWSIQRDRVINNPKWFKEVTLIYVAKEQVKKVEKFLKKLI